MNAELLIDQYLGELERVNPTIRRIIDKSLKKFRHLRGRWIKDVFSADFTDPDDLHKYVDHVWDALMARGVKPEINTDVAFPKSFHKIGRMRKQVGGRAIVHSEPSVGKTAFYNVEISVPLEEI